MLFILEVYRSGFCFGTKHKWKHKPYNLPLGKQPHFLGREKSRQQRWAVFLELSQALQGTLFMPAIIPFIPGLTQAVQSGNFEFSFSSWKHSSIFLPHIILRERDCKKPWLKTGNFTSLYQSFHLSVFNNWKDLLPAETQFKNIFFHFIFLLF